tara:strand:+ start:193 stop:810 length:618 start_codon:yes stop_codon:yes gene_type:complete
MRESIKIQLPEDLSDITLEQSQKYISISGRDNLSDLDKTKKIVKLFTGLKTVEVDNMSIGDYESVILHIVSALNTEADFSSRFKLNGIEFGFIPNLDEITAGEYIDLTSSGTNPDSLHKTMAILFRPITSTDGFGSYEIEPYTASTKHQELMKKAPMNAVNGMMVFFCLLLKELQECTEKSTEALVEAARNNQTATLKNGVGTLV